MCTAPGFSVRASRTAFLTISGIVVLTGLVQGAPPADLQVADLVYIDYASWLQTAVLRTASDTVRVNQPGVSGTGLVGRTVLVTGPYAKIQLITDRAASVGVMIERTHRQGVIKGAGRGHLELDYVSLQADVRVGDEVTEDEPGDKKGDKKERSDDPADETYDDIS